MFVDDIKQSFFKSNIVTSSHQRCSVRKGALRNFAKLTGKHLCQSLCSNNVAGLRPTTLLKKRLYNYLKRDSGTGVFLWFLRSFPLREFWKRKCFLGLFNFKKSLEKSNIQGDILNEWYCYFYHEFLMLRM